MSGRLPSFLRTRAAERRRVDAFLEAIRASASTIVEAPAPATLPTPRVELVVGSRGPVWQLDRSSRARLRGCAVPR